MSYVDEYYMRQTHEALLARPQGLFEALDPPEVGSGLVLTNGLRAVVVAVEGDIIVVRDQVWTTITMRRVDPL